MLMIDEFKRARSDWTIVTAERESLPAYSRKTTLRRVLSFSNLSTYEYLNEKPQAMKCSPPGGV